MTSGTTSPRPEVQAWSNSISALMAQVEQQFQAAPAAPGTNPGRAALEFLQRHRPAVYLIAAGLFLLALVRGKR